MSPEGRNPYRSRHCPSTYPRHNQAEIQPYHGNGYHAGTPLNTQVQQSLIQGSRGGGGANRRKASCGHNGSAWDNLSQPSGRGTICPDLLLLIPPIYYV